MSVPVSSLAVAVVAALGGALFVSADTALGSLPSARVAALLEQPRLAHRAALERYRSDPWRLRSTYVVGRVLCSAVAAILLADVVGRAWPELPAVAVAVVLTLTLMAPLTELGTALARRNPQALGPLLATWLRPFELVLLPLSWPLSRMSQSLSARLHAPEASDLEVLAAEVEHIVDEVERSGAVGAEPAEMIRNVLEFEDTRAYDVMIPRSQVEAFALSTPLEELRRVVRDGGHSRYPVYDGELDNVVGIVSAKDVLKLDGCEPAERTVASILRHDVLFVAEQQRLSPLLRELRVRRQHLAVVVDEFGGTSGIVTLEDLLEQIVGDIRDEPAAEREPPMRDLGGGKLDVDAQVPVADLCAYLGAEAPSDVGDATLASLLPRDPAPEVGAELERWGLVLVVREVGARGVLRLEVHRPRASLLASSPALVEPPPPTKRAGSDADPPRV